MEGQRGADPYKTRAEKVAIREHDKYKTHSLYLE